MATPGRNNLWHRRNLLNAGSLNHRPSAPISTPRTIAVIANEFDPHADAAMLALRHRGLGKILRAGFETARRRHTHRTGYDNLSRGAEHVLLRHESGSADALPLTSTKTVYWRRATSHFNWSDPSVPNPEDTDSDESYWAFRGGCLGHCLRKCIRWDARWQ